MHLGLKNGPFVPHNLLPVQGIPVPLLKFGWPPDLDSQSVLWVEEKGAQMYSTCLSETRTLNSQHGLRIHPLLHTYIRD